MPKKLFEVGNPGGPGRRPKQREERVRAIWDENISDDDWREIVGATVAKAKGGSFRHVELVFAYGMGKPVQRVETSSDNPMAEKFEEWKRARLEAMQQFLMEQATAPVVRVVEDAEKGETE